MNVTYYPTIPNPPNDPSKDVGLMQINSAAIDTLFGIDHVSFNIVNGGYHKQATFQSVGYPPNPRFTPPAQFEMLYSGQSTSLSPEGNLYFARGTNPSGIQLTGPFSPSAIANGYTFLAGGILLQWGFVASANATNVNPVIVGFGIGFPNSCFSVITQPITNTSQTIPSSGSYVLSPATITPIVSSVTASSFTCTSGLGSSIRYGFYWLAVGN